LRHHAAPHETRHGIEPEFLDAADRFVQLANELNQKYSREWVRAAMMYATARYNAFVWITREDAPGQTLEQAAVYYASEYDKICATTSTRSSGLSRGTPAYGAELTLRHGTRERRRDVGWAVGAAPHPLSGTSGCEPRIERRHLLQNVAAGWR